MHDREHRATDTTPTPRTPRRALAGRGVALTTARPRAKPARPRREASDLRSLISNAASLVGTSAVSLPLGFAYWWIAAHEYPAAAVGIASAAVSAMLLLATVGVLGFGTLLIGEVARRRFDPAALVTTALTVVGGFGFVLGLVFALVASRASTHLSSLGDGAFPVVFAAGVGLAAAAQVLDEALIGALRGGVQFTRNVVFGWAKLIVLAALTFVVATRSGLLIYATWLVGFVISFAAVAAVLIRDERPPRLWQFDWGALKSLRRAAGWHHALNLGLAGPQFALPLLATTIVSPQAGAYFFTAWIIGMAPSVVPGSLTTALYAVSAAEPAILGQRVRQSLRYSFVTLLTLGTVLFVAGPFILGFFGEDYRREATTPLRIIVVAGFPLLVRSHFTAISRAVNRLGRAVAFVAFTGTLEVVAAAAGAAAGGIDGLALGWAAVMVVESLIAGPIVRQITRRGRAADPARSSTPSAALRRAAYMAAHDVVRLPLRRASADIATMRATGDPATIVRERLSRVLEHSSTHVPYYVRAFAHSVPGGEEDPFAILSALPILTKDTLRAEFDDLLSSDLHERRWQYNASSGSTGEPTVVVQDAEQSAYATATWFAFGETLGRRVGEPALYVWGLEREIRERAQLKRRILNYLANEKTLNAYRLTRDAIREFVDDINRRPPRLLIGYAVSLCEIAVIAREQGMTIEPQAGVISTAGTLAGMREEIEEAFGCAVYDQYGSRELGPVAIEVPGCTGLHVAPWSAYVEVVDADGIPVPPGQEGELVVTSLTNLAMPLVRYAVGDRGTLVPEGTCRCGRGGQILGRILGRTDDTFLSTDGGLVDGAYFSEPLWQTDWVRKFQVVQRDYLVVAYRIVLMPGKEPPSGVLDGIRAATRAALGADCEVVFEFPAAIDAGPESKYRPVVCEIPRGRGAVPEPLVRDD
jgi:phenylacetate-CoA ligase